jgi:hypothetical protein
MNTQTNLRPIFVAEIIYPFTRLVPAQGIFPSNPHACGKRPAFSTITTTAEKPHALSYCFWQPVSPDGWEEELPRKPCLLLAATKGKLRTTSPALHSIADTVVSPTTIGSTAG